RYATLQMLREAPPQIGGDEKITETLADKPSTNGPATLKPVPPTEADKQKKDTDSESRGLNEVLVAPAQPPKSEAEKAGGLVRQDALQRTEPAPAPTVSGQLSLDGGAAAPADAARAGRVPGTAAESKLMAQPSTLPADQFRPQEENRDRVEDFKTNPVHAALEDPVSTFAIDVDTAS
ncbi:von Willebrand factor type A domain-containing protein, partial [Mesorhizobium sp. M4A.F.Ca.ET.050.02.1.1]|uniref:VWA domain-containing protein n=1 Tax=Mesorhizobium sp. M4A.F.Ca.ET.050.02.1.1 TaxID=2496754 RepID=UPI001FE1785D